MTTGQGLFAGLALVAMAIIVVGLSSTGHAQSAGTWQISAGANGTAWKINAESGVTEVCAAPGNPSTAAPGACFTVK
jgi:hypothetical protein